jgi:hypothetical protein
MVASEAPYSRFLDHAHSSIDITQVCPYLVVIIPFMYNEKDNKDTGTTCQ